MDNHNTLTEYSQSDFFREFPNREMTFNYAIKIINPPFKTYKKARGLGWSRVDGGSYFPLTDTVFGGNRIGLDKMFYAVFLLHYNQHWSIRVFAKHLAVNPQAAISIMRRLLPHINHRISFKNNLDRLIRGYHHD